MYQFQPVTILLDKESTSIDSQHSQILELVTNSKNSLKLPVTTGSSELQNSVALNTEPVITIELETPEETPEDNIPDVNIPLKNESEDALSGKLFSEVDFPPDYFQNQTTDDRISSDENTIDDYLL